jgi:hypothetical protein
MSEYKKVISDKPEFSYKHNTMIIKLMDERDALQDKLKQLEEELEEERQENASLRSGSIDDYERGAE